ncbi:hypothetical protein PWE32_36470 [Streptomyces neyagawaensis]|nr:DUF6766 family protein [Streptomyces neyagawaensis]MCL6737915.1 hypothetical protein [Streptomyces neyagawaensis]MDE1687746.1 hypothetical protein [Streptomyces neyagawaensis]
MADGRGDGAVLVPLAVATGCGSVDERRTAALDAALDFERAVSARDGAAVCGVLAPAVREEVEQSAGTACEEGVLEEDVPSVAADFWNRTLQNWQSEFLAIASMAILSIYLRQRGSPESKPVGSAHTSTGVEG